MEINQEFIFTISYRLLNYNNRYTDLTDEELLLRYRQYNDNNWLGILLQRYTMLLLGVAMKYLKDKTSAEDAVQHIMLKTLTHLPQGEILNFKGWLYILMRNYCLQLLKEKKHSVTEHYLAFIATDDTSITAAAIEKEENLQQMEHALCNLVPEQRLCLALFYLNKKSYQEIMQQTGYDFMQVKSYIQNGKRNLKLMLTKQSNNQQ